MEAKEMIPHVTTHSGVHRKGRGFSCKEVVDAGLSCDQAVEMRIRFDGKRRSSHTENVEMLKKAASGMKFKSAAPKAKAPAAPKKKA